jgi:hypothetical protein
MESRERERRRWANREVEWSVGKSDIEGKAAREAASEQGNERVSNGREHMSQSAGSERVSIEERDFRDRRQSCEVAATECGQRRSFKIGCSNFCKGLFLKAAWRWIGV